MRNEQRVGQKLYKGGLAAFIVVWLSACHSFRESFPAGKPGETLQKKEALLYDYGKIRSARQSVKDGDLILRTGNDFTSLSLRLFSRKDKTYSHAGIASVEDGKVYVYHAIGGEDNPNEKLRKDRFEVFCNPRTNLGFGIYRYDFSELIHQRLDSIIKKYYQEEIPFDMQFNLKTDDRMYCAEFVYKSVIRASRDTGYLPVSYLHQFAYVATDNLFLNSHAKEICRVIFK